MGLLDNLGEALDRPWSASGATPEQISTNPWARRGLVLSALGTNMIPAWEQGHRNFGTSIAAHGELARRQAWENQQRAYAVQQAQAQAAQQAKLNAIFSEIDQQDPQNGPQAALADPSLGPPGPTMQRASASVFQPRQIPPVKERAEKYRLAAQKAMSIGSVEIADKLLKFADSLAPRPEYGQPVATAGGLVQFSKTGEQLSTGMQDKPAETPSDIRALEYITGKPMAGTGGPGLAALKDLGASRAPSTRLTVEQKGGMTWIEEISKDAAKRLSEAHAPAQAAAGIVTKLDNVIKQSQKGTFSGPMAQGAVGAAQFMSSIGVPVAPDTLVSTRLTEAAINGLVLDTMAANGGARGFTEKETQILMGAFPRLTDDPNSRIAIAKVLQQHNLDKIERYQSLREQSKKLPGFELYAPPEVSLPKTVPTNRPSLADIFGK